MEEPIKLNTIPDFNRTLTIFYNKRIGKVQLYYTGIQDFSVFGEEAEDYKLIWDKLEVPYDDFIIENFNDFVVDNGELCYSPKVRDIRYRRI